MGFSPQQVLDMSLWQFLAARDGWIRANSLDKTHDPLPPEVEDVLGAWLDEPPIWH